MGYDKNKVEGRFVRDEEAVGRSHKIISFSKNRLNLS